jgi:hypothetical protein
LVGEREKFTDGHYWVIYVRELTGLQQIKQFFIGFICLVRQKLAQRQIILIIGVRPGLDFGHLPMIRSGRPPPVFGQIIQPVQLHGILLTIQEKLIPRISNIAFMHRVRGNPYPRPLHGILKLHCLIIDRPMPMVQ